MMPRQPHGIRAIDLERGPGPDDWLVLAIGSERMVPVRTDRVLSSGRFAVVVHADPLPHEEALVVLARLVADGVACRPPEAYGGALCTQWACKVAAQIAAAVDSIPRPWAGVA